LLEFGFAFIHFVLLKMCEPAKKIRTFCSFLLLVLNFCGANKKEVRNKFPFVPKQKFSRKKLPRPGELLKFQLEFIVARGTKQGCLRVLVYFTTPSYTLGARGRELLIA
jgi:hypothetical protein